MNHKFELPLQNIKNDVNKYIKIISEALDNNNELLATQTFINFGAYFQEKYPGLGLDDLRKKIINLKMEGSQKLPNLDLVACLSEVRISIYVDIVTNNPNNKKDIYKMDALLKGMNLFSVVFCEEQFENSLREASTKISLEKENNARSLIEQSTYEVSPILTEFERKDLIALNAVTALRDIIERTLEQLKQQIMDESQHKLKLYPQESDFNKLMKSIEKIPKWFSLSIELQLAISSYKALKLLEKTLTEGSTLEKLMRFREALNKKPIKNALNSNADDNITKFLKVVDYIFKSLITFSIDHWIKQDPLKSTQQQAFNDAFKALKKPEEEEVIPLLPKSSI